VDAPKPVAVIEISVEIVAIHETANSLSIEATWTQTRPTAAGVTTVQGSSFSVPMANRTNGAFADSLSQAVAQLADAIVARLGG